MNSREKFHGVMSFEENIPNMKTEFGYWAGGIRKWFKEGLPKIEDIPESSLEGDLVKGSSPFIPGLYELVDKNVMSCFNLDSYLAKFPFDISPMLKGEVLEEDEHYRIFTDKYGITKKVTKENAATPLVVDYPIKNRDDFYRYIELYDNDFDKRLPKDWNNVKADLENRAFPIRLGGQPYGFSFFARHLMGDVVFMISMYDDPKLIKEFNEFFLNFVMNYWSKILDEIDVDCIWILEDIAYRNGCMISGEMFDEFMAPYYIRFVDFIKQYGVKNILVDCDGLVNELVPLWIKVGVTGIFPVEAVNDIVEIRDNYPKLQLLGGVDKTVLIGKGKRDIDEELERISHVITEGGYIPHIDHAVSEDISWENFKYYRERLNDIIDGKLV